MLSSCPFLLLSSETARTTLCTMKSRLKIKVRGGLQIFNQLINWVLFDMTKQSQCCCGFFWDAIILLDLFWWRIWCVSKLEWLGIFTLGHHNYSIIKRPSVSVFQDTFKMHCNPVFRVYFRCKHLLVHATYASLLLPTGSMSAYRRLEAL